MEECIVPGYLSSRCQVLKRQGQMAFTHDVWDHTIYGPKVLVDADGTFRMFYAGYNADYATYRICVATSANITGPWTKPSLGLFSYAGNTSNNIVLQIDGINLQFLDCSIDPLSGKYILSVRNDNSGANLLYESSNGKDFVYVASSSTGGGEQAGISWSPLHGKYRRWYRANAPLRSIGYFDSASLTGPWVDRGYLPEFTSTSQAVQFYDFSHFYYAGSMWAVVNMYAEASYVLSPLRLYRSDNHGDTWVRSTDLLRRAEPDAWDYGLVTDGCPILVDGVWYFIYGGKTGLHNQLTQITFGIATAVQNPAIANIKRINDALVTGAGTSLDRWRAA